MELRHYSFVPMLVLACSACVSIKAPDNLVSDSVKAGKDVYNTVKNYRTEQAPDSEHKVFSHSYPVPAGEPVVQSNSNCIFIALETAKKTLKQPRVDIAKTETRSIVENGKRVLECSVVLANPNQ